MSASQNKKTGNLVHNLCMAALFAALTCAGTFIIVPMPIGYFNLGDIVLLCAAWCMGPTLGMSAAVGAALADLLSGYVIYAPATLIIKSLMVVCAALAAPALCRILGRTASRAVSAACAECVMIGGYFLYESLLLGYGTGAAASIPGNALQALCGIIGGTALMTALTANRRTSKFFTRK